MIDTGWIKVHRQIIESEIWSKPPLYLKIWMYLLMKAQYADYKQLKRGQLFTSIAEIQEACSWKVGFRKEIPTKRQVYGVIDWMRKAAHEGYDERDMNGTMIVTTKVTHGMLININKYEDFQSQEIHEGNNEGTMKGTRTEFRGNNINKEYKELKNKELSTSAQKKSASKIYADDSVEMYLVINLLSTIQKWHPEYKEKNKQRWCDDFRKLLSLDNQSLEQVNKVIAWLPTSEFWRRNILSPAALRKHFDRLYAQMVSEHEKVIPIGRAESDEADLNRSLMYEWIDMGNTPEDMEGFRAWKKKKEDLKNDCTRKFNY